MALPSSADILESFDTHHPLVLPDGGYQFQLGREVADSALWVELDRLIFTLSDPQPSEVTATEEQKVQNMSWLLILSLNFGFCVRLNKR